MAQSEPYQPLEDAVFFGRKCNKSKGILPLPITLASEPLRLNPYVSGGEGLKGISLSLPWVTLIPGAY